VIAAPVIAIMFFAEFALALVSRFAPQIQVFILAMPIKSALAIGVLVIAAPILMRYALDQYPFMPGYFDRFYEILRVGGGSERP
jgi:type III secretion protein T